MEGPARLRVPCRFCGTPLGEPLVDFGRSPLSNDYVEPGQRESLFPLAAFVCETCFLVQVPAVVAAERIFSDYAYLSSYSDSWLRHVERYCAQMSELHGLADGSRVVEVGSNDGHLLRCFRARGFSVLGIDPAANVAQVARDAGIDTVTAFFGLDVARRLVGDGVRADLLIGNNVLPHVPDLNDFVAGLHALLADEGLLTLEFPHLMRLLQGGQFDTIYHEHFSYFSLATARDVFAAHGLRLVDVEELPTHGGSLRVHVRHASHAAPVSPAVDGLLAEEDRYGMRSLGPYERFADGVRATRADLREFLAEARAADLRVAGYGAPAKSTTLLNYCGIGPESIEYTVDRNPLKQGRTVPGTGIPILAPERLAQTRPDYVMILPWNLRDEIAAQLAGVAAWGARLVVPVPRVEVLA
ncbi:MAG: SAM-dependent methyltransferase [Solirubrobacterales bacterium]|nr:SAM-dependent methyltransferase [Solirubrobacterales bacterium]